MMVALSIKAGSEYLLPSRRAWTHCLASCVMSSSSVDPMTLEVLRADDGDGIVSPTLSTSGCTDVCSIISKQSTFKEVVAYAQKVLSGCVG